MAEDTKHTIGLGEIVDLGIYDRKERTIHQMLKGRVLVVTRTSDKFDYGRREVPTYQALSVEALGQGGLLSDTWFDTRDQAIDNWVRAIHGPEMAWVQTKTVQDVLSPDAIIHSKALFVYAILLDTDPDLVTRVLNNNGYRTGSL
jgi:hypothetical protein